MTELIAGYNGRQEQQQNFNISIAHAFLLLLHEARQSSLLCETNIYWITDSNVCFTLMVDSLHLWRLCFPQHWCIVYSSFQLNLVADVRAKKPTSCYHWLTYSCSTVPLKDLMWVILLSSQMIKLQLEVHFLTFWWNILLLNNLFTII